MLDKLFYTSLSSTDCTFSENISKYKEYIKKIYGIDLSKVAKNIKTKKDMTPEKLFTIVRTMCDNVLPKSMTDFFNEGFFTSAENAYNDFIIETRLYESAATYTIALMKNRLSYSESYTSAVKYINAVNKFLVENESEDNCADDNPDKTKLSAYYKKLGIIKKTAYGEIIVKEKQKLFSNYVMYKSTEKIGAILIDCARDLPSDAIKGNWQYLADKEKFQYIIKVFNRLYSDKYDNLIDKKCTNIEKLLIYYYRDQLFDLDNMFHIATQINDHIADIPNNKKDLIEVLSLIFLIQNPFGKKIYCDKLLNALKNNPVMSNRYNNYNSSSGNEKSEILNYCTEILLGKEKKISETTDNERSENLLLCRKYLLYLSNFYLPLINTCYYILYTIVFGNTKTAVDKLFDTIKDSVFNYYNREKLESSKEHYNLVFVNSTAIQSGYNDDIYIINNQKTLVDILNIIQNEFLSYNGTDTDKDYEILLNSLSVKINNNDFRAKLLNLYIWETISSNHTHLSDPTSYKNNQITNINSLIDNVDYIKTLDTIINRLTDIKTEYETLTALKNYHRNYNKNM